LKMKSYECNRLSEYEIDHTWMDAYHFT